MYVTVIKWTLALMSADINMLKSLGSGESTDVAMVTHV